MNEDIRDDERNPGSQVEPYADGGQDPSDEEIAEQAMRALRGEGDPLRGRRVASDPDEPDYDFSEEELSGYDGSQETDERPDLDDGDPDALSALGAVREQGGWFHGDEREIWNRIASLEAALEPVRRIIDSGFGSEAHVLAEAETEEELRTLRETAAVYSESVQEEFLENLPGGTVAMDYGNLIRGGVMDPGEDDGTPLYAAARDVAHEASTYNWEAFATRGARDWMRQKAASSPEMLAHEMVTRLAAVDYARDKTMAILDPVRRAAIVDAFVSEAERARRDEARANETTASRRQEAAESIEKAASSMVQSILDEEGLDWM